jgi:hypothetical protein
MYVFGYGKPTPVVQPPKPDESVAQQALIQPNPLAVPALTNVVKELPNDNPMKARIQEIIKRSPLDIKNTPSLPLSEPEEPFDLRQGFTTEADFIAILQKRGATLTSIELNYPTDAIFDALVTYCPNLTRLSHNASCISEGNVTLTNAGLLKVSQLPKLTSFRYCVEAMLGMNGEGILALLKCDNFVNNLKHLYISLFFTECFNDTHYQVVTTYKQLQSLYVHGQITKPETLEEYPLPATLTRFEFNQYAEKGLFTDTFLSSLPQGLTKFAASGSWNAVTPSGLQVMMQRLPNLKDFSLNGEVITPAQAASLTSTILITLNIGNCSTFQPSDFVGIVNNCPNLQTLGFEKADTFNNEVPLPTNLKSLTLETPKLNTFTAIPEGLEELTLIGIEYDYVLFNSLTRLKSLHTLRIIRCKRFNDGALVPLLEATKARLRFLELNGVSVTLEGAKKLAECPQLRTLVLNDLLSFTADNLSSLLSNINLQTRLQNLYIGDIELNLTNIGEILSKFGNLKLLFLMLMEMQVPNNLKMKPQTIICFWLGPTQYHQFLQLMK